MVYGDGAPIKDLRLFLFRAFTKHQLLLMKEIGKNRTNITKILKKLNLEEKIPEATLRFNAKKLKELGVIKFGNRLNKGEIAELTPLGLFFYEILNGKLKRSKFILRNQKIIEGENARYKANKRKSRAS